MNETARHQAVTDKFEIIEISVASLCCRDAGDWKGMVQCFHPDSRVSTSWFAGTASELAIQAGNMMAGHHPTDTQRHLVSNPRVILKGDRAVNEYYVILYQGRTLDGHEFDFQTWSVTLDLFERRDGAWRIARRIKIYEKDRMDSHVPGAVPQSYFDRLDLSRYPAAIRYHCYRNEKSSGQMPKNLILKGSPQEISARREAGEWLMTGS